jgi:G:T-mismatch repair DNA endonuclease (very short patch repair protein)
MKDLTASEIWLKDAKKIKLIRDRGYDIMIVWEYDYIRTPNEIIKNCLNFLYD